MNNLTPETIDKIIELKKPEVIEAGGYEFRDTGYQIVKPESVEGLQVQTLQSVIDFIDSDQIKESPENILIQIVSPECVKIYGPIDPKFRTRECFLYAVYDYGLNNPGWMDLEDFNIFLQSNFVKTEYMEGLLKFVSSVFEKTEVSVADDGISQSVNLSSGITRVNKEDVPNPVELRPHLTFPDIEQPIIPFVFRMRKSNSGISCRLIRADGGKANLEATLSIYKFLNENINNGHDKITILS